MPWPFAASRQAAAGDAWPLSPAPAPLPCPAVVQFLLAMCRIMLWRRWDCWAHAETLRRSATAALAAAVAAEVPQEPAEAAGPKEGSGKAEVALAPLAGSGQAAAGLAADQAESGATAGAEAGAVPPAAAQGGGRDFRSRLLRLRERALYMWSFRPAGSRNRGLRFWLVEAAICVAQALWPNLGEPCMGWRRACLRWPRRRAASLAACEPCLERCLPLPAAPAVTRKKFFLMRKAWLATGAGRSARLPGGGGGGKQGPSPDFVQHVLTCLENDLTTFGGCPAQSGCLSLLPWRIRIRCCWAGPPSLSRVPGSHAVHAEAAPARSRTAVGLSVEMGICVVVVVLLMGVTGK